MGTFSTQKWLYPTESTAIFCIHALILFVMLMRSASGYLFLVTLVLFVHFCWNGANDIPLWRVLVFSINLCRLCIWWAKEVLSAMCICNTFHAISNSHLWHLVYHPLQFFVLFHTKNSLKSVVHFDEIVLTQAFLYWKVFNIINKSYSYIITPS